MLDYLRGRKIDLVINIPKNYQKDEFINGYLFRRAAVDYKIMLMTNRQIVMPMVAALSPIKLDALQVKSRDAY